MLDGGRYDSISRGAGGDAVSTAYPFPVNSNAANQNERERKAAKLAWLVGVAKADGFPVVVQRQADKYVYVEIGDPDAPEMIMALSHLDSPTASVSAAQLARWRGADGLLGPASAYYPNSTTRLTSRTAGSTEPASRTTAAPRWRRCSRRRP